MRAVLMLQILVVAAVPAYAGALPSRTQERPQFPGRPIDLNAVSPFRGPSSEILERGMFPRKSLAPPVLGNIMVPSMTLGPFQATLGGQAPTGSSDLSAGSSWGSHTRRGDGPRAELVIETESFWGSHIGGSVDTRGARLTFTWTTP